MLSLCSLAVPPVLAVVLTLPADSYYIFLVLLHIIFFCSLMKHAHCNAIIGGRAHSN